LISRNCERCGADLSPGELACKQCHALVHAAELERLSATATQLEGQGELSKARDQWLASLALLPQNSTQAEWVQNHLRTLNATAARAARPGVRSSWARRLGPLAPLVAVLAKSKALLALFKLKFLLSLAVFAGFYWSLYGAWFGVGFAALILIHELGHFVDIKRRGLPAEMPVFLPGLGAYVRWQALGVSTETRAAVSLAGPLAGWAASAACALIWLKTGGAIWAGLARAGAWLNALNLIPVWVLDGAQAVLPLDKAERMATLALCVALGLLLGESVFFLVAAGMGYRLFTKDLPAHSSRPTTIYFLAVLISLGLLLWLLPGKGFGVPRG
jgi:Zn-dependent protease